MLPSPTWSQAVQPKRSQVSKSNKEFNLQVLQGLQSPCPSQTLYSKFDRVYTPTLTSKWLGESINTPPLLPLVMMMMNDDLWNEKNYVFSFNFCAFVH